MTCISDLMKYAAVVRANLNAHPRFGDVFLCSYKALPNLTASKYYYSINPRPAKVIYLNFQPPEIVSRYRDPRVV